MINVVGLGYIGLPTVLMFATHGVEVAEQMKRNLASGIKVFDPWVKRDIVENQYHDFEQFLEGRRYGCYYG